MPPETEAPPSLPPAPDTRDRIARQERLLEEVREHVTRSAVPYYGHLRLKTDRGTETDVLLGPGTRITPQLSIVDWLHAPLAEVFFTQDEGEPYEVELDGRFLTGHVIERNLVVVRGGVLESFEGGGKRYQRQGEAWTVTELPPSWHSLRPASARTPFRSPLEVTLDPAQQAIVDLPSNQSVLILGEAGYGKTTVALHRLVALGTQRPAGNFKAAVIVPTEGLRRLTSLMLDRRDALGYTEVWTYDEWAMAQARRVFKDLPKRESTNTRSVVQRLKRHPAVLPVLQAFLKERPTPTIDPERPRRPQSLASRLDLEQFFGDRAWTSEIVRRSDGALPASSIEETAQQTKIQFLDSTERSHRGIDADALVTSDGRRIDEGTPLEDAESLDVEDCAVMFAIDRMRAADSGREAVSLSAQYDCVVLDESQEFSPIELSLVGRSLAPGGTLIVSGDAAQRVDPAAFFSSWTAVLEALGVPGAAQRELQVNYRCPPDVTELARAVLSLERPMPVAQPSVTHFGSESPFHLAFRMSEALQLIRAEDPLASVAIVCRSGEVARALGMSLRHGVEPRLSLNGNFDFRPGVIVTSVADVKGLEFDYVLIPDASAGAYPDADESRRALYVGVTRATHRLLLATASAWSPLLRLAEPLQACPRGDST